MSDRNFLLFLLALVAVSGGMVWRNVRNDNVCIERSGMPCDVLIEKLKGFDR